MKKMLMTVAIVAMSVCSVNAQTMPVLNNGKNIPIRLTADVYSNAKVSAEVVAIVDSDIKSDNGTEVLIRRGTPIEVNAQIQKARGVGKPASVKFNFVSTTAVDGQKIRLQGAYNKVGDSRRGVALGVGLGVGIPICWPCLFCLCIKGEKITIPEGTVFNAVVNDVYHIAVER